MKKRILFAGVFAHLFLVSLLYADIVVLKDGRRFEGKVTEKGKTVELRKGTKKTVFDRSEIARIEKRKSAQENIEFFGVNATGAAKAEGAARRTGEHVQVQMVLVPAGDAPPSNVPGEAARKGRVKIFLMDRTEVTNAQYALFLKHVGAYGDGPCAHPEQPPNKDHTPKHWDDPKFNQQNQPVVGVDWFDACAFAKWAGKRLPRLEEWRLAAGAERAYPWGDEPHPRRCNHGCLRTLDSGERKLYTDNSDGFGYAAPVGSFASDQGPFGCFDMAGNVSEWTATMQDGKACRCGGNLCQPVEHCRNSTHRFMDRSLRSFTSGFRCAKDVE